MLRGMALAAMILALVPGVAQATHAPAKQVTAQNFNYFPAVTGLAAGDHLTLTNRDGVSHDIESHQTKADGTPLFVSPLVGQDQTAAVAGVEDLEAGAYSFFCTLHPQMTGAITVGFGEGSTPTPPSGAGQPLVGIPGLVPTASSVTPRNGRLYVAGWAQRTIYEIALLPGGVPGPALPYVTGVGSPLGVVMAADGTLFVADSHPSQSIPGRTAGRVWAFPPGGGNAADVGEIVVDELPNGRHNTNGMAIRDGRLYITNGNATDNGIDPNTPELPLSGTLISVPLDARDVVVGQPSADAIRLEAQGMRNVYDVAFRPGTAEAWLTSNGPDTFDPWGEDLLLMADASDARVEDFGFPECLYGRGPGGEMAWIQNPTPGITDACSTGSHDAPEQLMGLHVSADGLEFGPQGGFWDGDLFVAEWGNLFGTDVVGHRVVRVPMDGGESSPPVDFLPSPAPLDLTFAGGDMYIADFVAGIVHVKAPPVALPPTRRRIAR